MRPRPSLGTEFCPLRLRLLRFAAPTRHRRRRPRGRPATAARAVRAGGPARYKLFRLPSCRAPRRIALAFANPKKIARNLFASDAHCAPDDLMGLGEAPASLQVGAPRARRAMAGAEENLSEPKRTHQHAAPRPVWLLP